MKHDPRVLTTLSEFVRLLLTPYDVDAVLDDLTVRLQEVLELTGCGVSLAGNGKLQMATAIPERIIRLEREQERMQLGPCVSAFRSGEVVTVPDLQDPSIVAAWPDYCAVAAQIGIASVAGVPMKLGEQTVGAIDLHSAAPREWPSEQLTIAQIFADAATAYLINASTYDRQQRLNEQLQQALDSRVVIEQAKGIIAEARGIDVDAAFQIIRRHARSHGSSLRAVADAIVSLGLRLQP